MEKKEAMKILKDFHDNSALFSVRTALDTVLPALKEGEDERIRKELLKHLKEGADGYESAGGSEDYKRWLDWFEKQMGANGNDEEIPNSEQKSTWSKEDEKMLDTVIEDIIKKAVGRLKHYLDNGLWVANDVGVREKEAIIEDFVNYMKGE